MVNEPSQGHPQCSLYRSPPLRPHPCANQVLGDAAPFSGNACGPWVGRQSHPHCCVAPGEGRGAFPQGRFQEVGSLLQSRGRAEGRAEGAAVWMYLLAQLHSRRPPSLPSPGPTSPAMGNPRGPVSPGLLLALGGPRRVWPGPRLAHSVISSLSPWSPRTVELSDAGWPLEPVCEVRISAAQTCCVTVGGS